MSGQTPGKPKSSNQKPLDEPKPDTKPKPEEKNDI
jgi:hypothetical protein|tara:strand:+ start:65 stop:169 length:105 start_codon:yes stop_codon:yes gene_type:complete